MASFEGGRSERHQLAETVEGDTTCPAMVKLAPDDLTEGYLV